MNNDVIGSVTTRGLCSGCGLCAAIAGHDAVEMTISSAGFARPKVLREISAIDNAKIRRTCPGVGLDGSNAPELQVRSRYWGYVQSCLIGYSNDVEVRYQGSSGGVISALAIHLLEIKSVKFVVQISADSRDPIGNQLSVSRTREHILQSAGSRYYPSSPLKNILEILDLEEPFAFVGKPCDVAALRAYAHEDSRVSKYLKCCISFMCAGIPSRRGAEKIVSDLGVKMEDLVSFRYRGEGWPGYAQAQTRDGTTARMDYAKSWGSILNRHLQFRCKICPDGTGEFADITCADAWYGKDGYPDFDERDGRSLILVRTSVGDEIIRGAAARSIVSCQELPLEQVAAMQPYQLKRKQLMLARLLGMALRFKRIPRYRDLGLLQAMRGVGALEWIRDLVGTFRRAGQAKNSN